MSGVRGEAIQRAIAAIVAADDEAFRQTGGAVISAGEPLQAEAVVDVVLGLVCERVEALRGVAIRDVPAGRTLADAATLDAVLRLLSGEPEPPEPEGLPTTADVLGLLRGGADQ